MTEKELQRIKNWLYKGQFDYSNKQVEALYDKLEKVVYAYARDKAWIRYKKQKIKDTLRYELIDLDGPV